jgi:hypothetical protein
VLKATQHEFLRLISARHGVESALAGGRALVDDVIGDERLGPEGRLQIYANMYGLRLQAALVACYPILDKIVDGWDEVTLDYIEAHPSHHPSLRFFGSEMARFLRDRGHPWLHELAALEWARHDIYDAADQPALDPQALAEYGPETIADLRLRLIDAHRQLAVEHAVERVWRAAKADEEHEEPAREPRTLLVWRDGVTVFHRRAQPGVEEEALRWAVSGLTFAELCERLIAVVGEDDAPPQAGALVGRWVADRLLAQP